MPLWSLTGGLRLQRFSKKSTLMTRRQYQFLGIVLAVTAVYFACFAVWYSGTPLGQNPVLDGREMLQMAEDIRAGELPNEPFYRAPLYPYLLSLTLSDGDTVATRALKARWFNGLFHVITTVMVFLLALRVWRHDVAALLSGLLWGGYPVALHFAGDPLDTTLGITWLLAALLTTVLALERKVIWLALPAGLLLGLATLTRPHALAVGGGWLVLLAIASAYYVLRQKRETALVVAAHAALSGLGLMLVLVAFGAINQARSGVFTLMPTQGGYNLWAANKPGANGRYFVQSVSLQNLERHINPASYEANHLYQAEHGEAADTTTVNAYWRNRALAHMTANPVDFAGHVAAKAYFLIHNHEQYNNKTYAVHKARSPWLWWHPLGWTLLLVAAILACVLSRLPTSALTVIAWLMCYAAGLLLFYVSARFRLPLAAMLAVLAGGLYPANLAIRQAGISRARLCLACALVVILAGMSLFAFGNVRDPKTLAQDYLLMAQAAFDVGQDEAAYQLATHAQDIRADLPAARELEMLASYNRVVVPAAAEGRRLPEATYEAFAQRYRSLVGYSPQADTTYGIYLWQLGQSSEAVTLWRRGAATPNPSQELATIALFLTRNLDTLEATSPLTRMAKALRDDPEALRQLSATLPEPVFQQQLNYLGSLFAKRERTN